MSEFLRHVRSRQVRQTRSFTGKDILVVLAVAMLLASAFYWWGVQRALTDNGVVAGAFTAVLVLAPPILTSFLIPWSPAGMLLLRINARTWGHAVVIACSAFLAYYSFTIQSAWWGAQPTASNAGLVALQALIGVIGFIIVPALVWTPVTPEELIEQARQAHLVKRYELQTEADIAILRNALLRAQEKALIGLANLTIEEREELYGVMKGLVTSINNTLIEVGESVRRVSGAMVPFESLEDNEDVQQILNYIGETLLSTALPPAEEEASALEPQQHVKSHPTLTSAQPTVAMSPAQQQPQQQAVVVEETASESEMSRVATERDNATPDRQRPTVSDDHFVRLMFLSDELKPGWKSAEVAELLRVSQRTAQRYIDVWLKQGLIREVSPNQYDIIEGVER